MSEGLSTFTALEIATAIGWSKKRAQSALADCPATATKEASGNPCPAWSTSRFPKSILREADRIREVHRYRNIEAVLRDPAREWKPALQIGRIHAAEIKKAEQLREALSISLSMPDESSIRARALAAMPNYERAFGYGVSERQLRTLLTRTLDRDRGAKNFARLEIYLADAPWPKVPSVSTGKRMKGILTVRTGNAEFEELAEDFATVIDPLNPTVEERAFCWRKIVETYTAKIEDGAKEAKLKKALNAFVLDAMPSIAESGTAFRRNLNRKLSLALTEGALALVDRRKNSGRKRHIPTWQEDIMRLARASRAYGARIAQAYRELMLGTHPSGEQFSEEFRAYYSSYNVRRYKSDVPEAVVSAVRPMMEATDALAHGPKAARLAAPSIRRDWTMLPAGASFTADDVTFNHYSFDWCEEGKYEFRGRRFNVTRNQTLVFCDERTGFVLGFSLCPRPQYSADDICAAVCQLCMDPTIGLPTLRFLFERSIWMGKKVKGQVAWAKREEGFLKEGIELGQAHATTPKAKIIERVLGSLQNMMQALPCYIGRNERLDHYEREEAFLKSLKEYGQPLKAEVNPADRLLSTEAIANEIEKTMRRFNAEPQNGERLPGISPEEGWKRFRSPAPSKVLPESLRYLLATQQSEVTVTQEGICLRVGRNKHFYCESGRLGELIGEKVRVRYNPDLPEMVTVCHPASDPKELHPFSVPLDKKIPAIGATAEDFAAARSSRKAFAAFGKSIFRAIAPANICTIQSNSIATPEAIERGERIQSLVDEHTARAKTRAKHAGTIRQLASRQGLSIDPNKLRNPDAAVRDLQLADELEAEIERQEAENAGNHL